MLIFLKAFFVGGLICVIGQILIDVTKMTPARILVTFVVLGVILGAAGVYDKLVDFAGAGATVPLTGFGNVLVNGTKEAIREKGLLGVLTGPLCAGSAGIAAGVLPLVQVQLAGLVAQFRDGGGAVGTCGFVFCKTEKQIKNTRSKAECS